MLPMGEKSVVQIVSDRQGCMQIKFLPYATTKPKPTEIMEMILEKKTLPVHPTRMPITGPEVNNAIKNVQRRCGLKAGERSAQAWNYLSELLGRCKHVRNRMISSRAGFGTVWPQAISNGQEADSEADSRKPVLLDKS